MLLRNQPISHQTQRLTDDLWRRSTNVTEVAASFETYRRSKNHRQYSNVTVVDITVADFQRLRPVSPGDHYNQSRWINDQIVDFISLALRVREITKRRVRGADYQAKYVGAATMWECIRRSINDDSEMDRICRQFGVRLFAFQTLIIPVNLNNTHWVFMVIKPKEKLVIGYNSLASSFEDRVMPNLLYWFEKEADRLHMAFNRDEWSFELHPHCPRQTNSVDCGIMMLTGMLFTCDDLRLAYSQAQMNLHRTRWAADILEGKITDAFPPPTDQDRKDASNMDNFSTIFSDAVSAPL